MYTNYVQKYAGVSEEMCIRDSNLRLVAHIVKKYYALPGDQDDLISIGTIGLMKAVDTFDSEMCIRDRFFAPQIVLVKEPSNHSS